MKKILIVVGVLFVIVIGALAALPALVSSDKLKGQIENMAAQNLQGKLKISSLSFSAIPTLKFTMENVEATPAAPFNGEKLATIKKLEVRIPILALLFAPKLNLHLEEADIQIVSIGPDSTLSKFLKAATPEASTPKTDEKPQELGESLDAMPSYLSSRIEKARIDLSIVNSSILIKSKSDPAAASTELKKLNLSLSDVGFKSDMTLNFESDLNHTVPGGLVAEGHPTAKGVFKLSPEGNKTLVDYDVEKNLSELSLKIPGTFNKEKGTELSLRAKGSLVKEAQIMNIDVALLEFIVGSAKLGAALKLSNFGGNDPGIDFKAQSDNVDLKALSAMIAPVKTYSLSGDSQIKILANGPLANPSLDILLTLKNISGKTPALSHPISQLKGKIAVKGSAKDPAIEITGLGMNVASSDLAIDLKAQGLAAPQASLQIKSNLLNADELLGLQELKLDREKSKDEIAAEEAEKKAVKEAVNRAKKGEGPALPSLDESLDAMAPGLDESLKNPMLDKAKANISLNVKKVVALRATFTNATMNLNYAARKLSLSKGNINGYGGAVNFDMGLELVPKTTGFSLSTKLSKINLGEFLSIHGPSWQGMASGLMNGDFSVSGKGLRKKQINDNLSGKLNVNLEKGALKIPVVKMVGGIIEKLPGGKKANPKGEFSGDFKTAKIVGTIKGRVFTLDPLLVQYDPASSGVGDLELNAKGTLNFDRQLDMTGLALLEPGTIPYTGLRGPSGKDEIPVRFKGDMAVPEIDYAYSVKIVGPRLAKGYMQSEGGQKAKQEVKQQVEKLSEKAPEPVKNLLKKFKF